MDPTELDAKLEEHGSRVKEMATEIKDLVGKNDTESKARIDELNAQTDKLMEDVEPLLKEKAEADAKARLEQTTERLQGLEAQFAGMRTASKAKAIGSGFAGTDTSYVAGAFLSAIVAQDPSARGWSPEGHAQGKATLDALSQWVGEADLQARYGGSYGGKATLATTDATGGWIVPNALVEELIKPAVQGDPYRSLVTVREGVTAFQIDQPWRGAAPARMTIASRGAAKENVDLTYNGYTVTMYTLARIHDIANQFLKQSAGAAERDVMEELASAATLGEQYYIMEGAGTTEPYGLATALTNSIYSDEIVHTPATGTLAGSVATAINAGAGLLAGRSVRPNAAVMSATSFWLALSQGADAAGFYFPQAFDGSDPFANPVRVWGIPLIPDANLVGTDDLIVGNFKALKVYFGDTFRIDSSSVAGTRWDENETGFRGEFEMGLDARAAVFTGNFTRSTDVTP
jgi:HK97 family phage major capsid protein